MERMNKMIDVQSHLSEFQYLAAMAQMIAKFGCSGSSSVWTHPCWLFLVIAEETKEDLCSDVLPFVGFYGSISSSKYYCILNETLGNCVYLKLRFPTK